MAPLGMMPATKLLERYRAGSLSPVDVLTEVLDRIDRLDGKLNAFTEVWGEEAMAEARASEARWQKKEPAGLLDGVPVTVKDLVLTRGHATRRGSHLVDPDQRWGDDGPATARLREAAAIIIGKTTTPEFGWKALGDSPLTGVTRNPWDLERSPGGSSAGAAAATAVGMGALAVGTDGGGSIRIPSSFTGLTGFKATFGRIPAYPMTAFGTVSHVGPMARSVSDCALMLNVLSRPDSRDWYALPPDPRDYLGNLDAHVRGLRIGFTTDFGGAPVHPDIVAAVNSAVSDFRVLGIGVSPVDVDVTGLRDAFFTHWASAAAKIVEGVPEARRGEMDPGLIATAAEGAKFSATDLIGAEGVRVAFGQQMMALHQRFDLLLTPTVRVQPLKLGSDLSDPATERHWIDWATFSYPFNMSRQPSITIPGGVDSDGLPIGLQLVGPLYGDALVLRAAYALEQTKRPLRPPMA